MTLHASNAHASPARVLSMSVAELQRRRAANARAAAVSGVDPTFDIAERMAKIEERLENLESAAKPQAAKQPEAARAMLAARMGLAPPTSPIRRSFSSAGCTLTFGVMTPEQAQARIAAKGGR